jgi:hypothetical protein
LSRLHQDDGLQDIVRGSHDRDAVAEQAEEVNPIMERTP